MALTMALAGAGCDFGPLGPSNQFDPEAPDDLQALVVINGSVVRAGGLPVSDLRVLAIEPIGGADIASTTTDEVGRFSITTLARAGFLIIQDAGCEVTRIPLPDLAPGQLVDLGRVDVPVGAGTLSVKGHVASNGASINDANIEVTLMLADPTGDVASPTCIGSIAETRTGPDGVFTIEGIPGGDYVAVARGEGLTVAVSPRVELRCDGDLEPDAFAFDISVGSADTAITLRSDDANTPDGMTRVPKVRVETDASLSWADAVVLSEDATLTTSTGQLPFTAGTPLVYPPNDDVSFLGQTNTIVYARFRSSCAESPLYASRITYDPDAPFIVSLSVDDVAVSVEPDGPLTTVIIADDRPAVRLAIDALDATGLELSVAEAASDEPDAPFNVTSTFSLDGGDNIIALRELISISPQEGRQRFQLTVADPAGNVLGAAINFAVLRDLVPPTTPLPATTLIETTSDRVLVWLDERDCPLTDAEGNVTGYERKLICEENEAEFPFQVRGGPQLVDFTSFTTAPFVVPVFTDKETEIEIRAVDAAGNPSISLGTVTVTQTPNRMVFSTPPNYQIKRGNGRSLVAAGSSVLTWLEPISVLADTVAEVLVAQPATLPDLGVEPGLSLLPEAVRKLSYEPFATTFFTLDGTSRWVGGVAAAGGQMTWMEDFREGGRTSARRFLAAPNDSGYYTIASDAQGFEGTDPDGDPAPDYAESGANDSDTDRCLDTGNLICRASDAHSRVTDELDFAAALSARGTSVVASVGGEVIDTRSAPVVETLTIDGPAFVGAQLGSRIGVPVGSMTLNADVAPGLELPVGRYWSSTNNDTYFLDKGGYTNNAEAYTVTSGSGEEYIMGYDALFVSYDDPVLVGMIIPEGESITVPVVEYAPNISADDGFPIPEGPSVEQAYALGFVHVPLAGGVYTEISGADVMTGLQTNRLPQMQVQYRRLGAATVPLQGGLTVDIARNGKTAPLPLLEDINVDEGGAHAVYAQHLTAREELISDTVPTPTEVVIPETFCRTVFEVTEKTALSDIRVSGAGLLDNLSMNLYYRESGGALLGTYNPISPFRPSQNSGLYLYFDAATDDPLLTECEDVVLAGQTPIEETVTVPSSLLTSTTTTLGPATQIAFDSVTSAGEFVLYSASIAELPVAVSPTQIFHVRLNQGVGDSDLYVRFDGEPTTADYDCRPFGGGQEDCFVQAPAGASQLYVGVEGYLTNNEANVVITPLDIIGPLSVTAGARVELRAETDAPIYTMVLPGDLDTHPVLVGFDDECVYGTFGFGTDATCGTFPFGAAGDYYVAVSQEVPTPVTIVSGATGGPAIEQVNAYAVEAGQRVDVVKSHGEAGLLVGFTAPLTADNADCEDTAPTDETEPLRCDLIVPEGVDTVYVAIENAPLEETATVTTTLSDVGCDTVYARRGSSMALNDAQIVLEPGYYVAALEGTTGFQQWPTENAPRVARGPLSGTVDDGPIKYIGAVGAASEPSNFADPMTLITLSDEPLCSLEIRSVVLPRFTALGVTEDSVVAISTSFDEAGMRDQSATAFSVSDAPGAEQSLGLNPAAEYKAVSVIGNRAAWISTNTAGQSPQIGEWDTDTDFSSPSCLNISGSPSPMTVSDAQFEVDGDVMRVLVGGSGVGGGEARLYEATLENDGCQSWVLTKRTFLDGAADAVAFSGRDGFAFVTDEFGVSDVVHINLRTQTELVPGGLLQTVGLGNAENSSIVSLFRSDTGEGRLIEIDHAPLSGPPLANPDTPPARELGSGKLWFSPRVIGTQLVALRTRPSSDAPRFEVVVRPLSFIEAQGEDALMDDENAYVLADASELFVDAPPFDPLDPLAMGTTPVLATDGRFLAVLGYDGSERHIAIYDLSTGDGPATQQRLFEATQLQNDIVSLTGGMGMVAVVHEDTTAEVYRYDGVLNSFMASDVGSDGAERVLGATDGGLVVLENVASTSPFRVPTFLSVALRSSVDAVDTTDTRRIPGGTYLHKFTSVLSNARGEVFLYDTTAAPAVLWRLPVDGGAAVPDAGVLRPLAGGTTLTDPIAVNANSVTAIRQESARSSVVFIGR